MQNDTATIKRFTDLRAWQEAKALAVGVYKETKAFPHSEMFGLTSQTQRAAVSISANIAEGFARRTAKDKRGFYQTGLASLSELESHLLIAQELELIAPASFHVLQEQMHRVGKLLTGLLRTASDRL